MSKGGKQDIWKGTLIVNIENIFIYRISLTITCKRRGKPSRRRALRALAFHFAVVKFLCKLPLVPRRAMAVCVHLHFSLASPFATGMARVLEQIVVVVLVVASFLKRQESFHVCRHLDRDRGCFDAWQTRH